ncbi:MAG: hypothetical protein V3U92_10830 [Cellulophaga sp.]
MADKEYYREYRKQYSKKVKYLNVSIPMRIYKEMQQLATKEDTKVSKLFKDMAIAYMQQKTYVPKEISEDLKEVKLLIRNVANNVNQVAHHSNIINGMVNENDLLEELRKLENIVNDYTLKKLKKTNDY